MEHLTFEDLSEELKPSVMQFGKEGIIEDLQELIKQNPELFPIGSSQHSLVMKDIYIL